MTTEDKDQLLLAVVREHETAMADLQNHRVLLEQYNDQLIRVVHLIKQGPLSVGGGKLSGQNALVHGWPSTEEMIGLISSIDELEKRVKELQRRLRSLGISKLSGF